MLQYRVALVGQKHRACGEALIEAVRYKLHRVFADNGIQCAYLAKNRRELAATYMRHMFDMRCRENGIEHHLTKPNHPYTNNQV